MVRGRDIFVPNTTSRKDFGRALAYENHVSSQSIRTWSLMGFHTFPMERADALRGPERYRYCSREELIYDLALEPSAVVADLGSGTGFYTDEVAPFAGAVYAVDVQTAMHDRYREHGIPENVETVTAAIETLPFDTDGIDAAFSIVTHHEYASDEAFAELARVIRPGGRLVTVDWSADGSGVDGPSMDERFPAETAADHLREAGFDVLDVRERRETFSIVAEG